MLRRIAASIVPPYEKSSFLFNILLSDIDVLIVSWCARVLLSFLYQQGYISKYFSAYSAHSLLVDLVTENGYRQKKNYANPSIPQDKKDETLSRAMREKKEKKRKEKK